MARRKGSKNRTTLERELTAAGKMTIDLTKADYKVLAAQAATIERPTLPPHPKDPPEKTIINPEEAKAIMNDARRRFEVMVDYYTNDEDAGTTGEDALIPERIQEYLRLNVFMASTVEEARAVAHKALNKLHIHLLTLWRDKRIAGPDTARNIEKRAQKAEKWAVRLDNLGRHEAAKRQRERVATIRATPPNTAAAPWMD